MGRRPKEALGAGREVLKDIAHMLEDGDFDASYEEDRRGAPSWQRRRGVRPGVAGCGWRRYSAPSSTLTNLWVKESSVAAAEIHIPIRGMRAWRAQVLDEARWALAGTGKDGQPRRALNAVNAVTLDVKRRPEASEAAVLESGALELILWSNVLDDSESTSYLPLASASLQGVYSGGKGETTPGAFLRAARLSCRPVVLQAAGETVSRVALQVVAALSGLARDVHLQLLVQVSPTITNVFERPVTAAQVVRRSLASGDDSTEQPDEEGGSD